MTSAVPGARAPQPTVNSFRGDLASLHSELGRMQLCNPLRLGASLLRSLIALREADSYWERFDGVLLPQQKQGHLEKVKRMIGERVDFEVRQVTDRYGQTAFHHLAAIKSKPYVRLLAGLCEHRPADIDRTDNEKRTALHVATEAKNLSAIRLLLRCRASATATQANGRTALLVAAVNLKYTRQTASFINSEIVSYLASKGVFAGLDFTADDRYGNSVRSLMETVPAVRGAVGRGMLRTRRWVREMRRRLLERRLVEALVLIVGDYMFGDFLSAQVSMETQQEKKKERARVKGSRVHHQRRVSAPVISKRAWADAKRVSVTTRATQSSARKAAGAKRARAKRRPATARGTTAVRGSARPAARTKRLEQDPANRLAEAKRRNVLWIRSSRSAKPKTKRKIGAMSRKSSKRSTKGQSGPTES